MGSFIVVGSDLNSPVCCCLLERKEMRRAEREGRGNEEGFVLVGSRKAFFIF